MRAVVDGDRTKARDGLQILPNGCHGLRLVWCARRVGINDQVVLVHPGVAQQRLDRALGVVGAGVGEEGDGGEHFLRLAEDSGLLFV